MRGTLIHARVTVTAADADASFKRWGRLVRERLVVLNVKLTTLLGDVSMAKVATVFERMDAALAAQRAEIAKLRAGATRKEEMIARLMTIISQLSVRPA